ncbi:DUF6286 domain-containing protein [Salinibacterium sp.]|uniref:DUF6286 domain-containing protein n=1 Tax=Salinibacterium sp. TaxID=1915057 RepID=UPI00286B3ACA|nr:DUF6286 domain-containing protein [Salinibacterium sp.]
MSTPNSLYSRIARRETTSPRSVLAITLAVLVIVLCVYAAVETALSMTGQPALVATPAAMADAFVGMAGSVLWILTIAGMIAAIVGFVLIVVSLTPGWRPRHLLPTGRMVTIVDDEVTASALARKASYEGNVDPDNARVSISRRRAVVTLTAISGTKIGTQPVKDAVAQQLSSFGLSPSLSSKVVVASERKVGA